MTSTLDCSNTINTSQIPSQQRNLFNLPEVISYNSKYDHECEKSIEVLKTESVNIETTSPLYKINELTNTENIETDINIKKDGTTIKLQKERMIDVLNKSKTVSTPKSKVELEDALDKSQTIINTTNKNAYEIRFSILQEAIEWIKYTKQSVTNDKLMEVASLFYKFVENKNNK